MARQKIHFEDKRNELLRRIWDIFMAFGYEHTTLALIIKELNVSKGAFYHYFSSKEACADAAVELFSRTCCDEIAGKMDEKEPADAQFKHLIQACAGLFQENEKRMEDINTPANAIFHLKLMASLVKTMAPLFEKVIVSGVEEEIFETDYPLENAQMLLTLSNFYFDADLFKWEPESMPNKLLAFEDLLTAIFKAKPGTFDFLHTFD